jgi:DNA replication protein DnaC
VPHLPRYSFTARFCRPCPACKVRYACAPPEFDETTFDGFERRSPELAGNLANCREFAALVNERGCGFLLMCGFTGSGKTRLACNIIREVRSSDCLYVTQSRITLLHRETYGHRHHHLHRSEESEEDEAPQPQTIWKVVEEVHLLVLDELGAHALAPDVQLPFDDLLRHRYDHRKPTILISNLALKGTAERPGLKQILGDPLTDRIHAATGHGKFVLQFSADSYRRTGGADYFAGLA